MLTSLLSLAMLDAGGPGILIVGVGLLAAIAIIVVPIIIAIITLITHGIKERKKRNNDNQ